MDWVLGIGGSNHDFSATLLGNGALHTCIEDERVTRHRYGDTHWTSRPCWPSTRYCLDAAGLELRDLGGLFISADIEGHHRFWESRQYEVVGHHLCHAAAAYFTSPFEEAAILVIDGRGGPVSEPAGNRRSFETISMGEASGTAMEMQAVQRGQHAIATSTWSYISSNSIGWFYSIVTEVIGLGENGEGKTMALAAYGEPRFVDALKQFIAIREDTIFEMDPYAGIWDFLVETIHRAPDSFSVRADLAASAQSILEEVVLKAALKVKKTTGKRNLVLGGGVALNGVANHLIRAKAGFDEVYVFAASGDNGLSCGAALYGNFCVLGRPRPEPAWSNSVSFAFGGRDYSATEIQAAYKDEPLAASSPRSLADTADELVDRLMGGQIVAVYQNGAEFGPRALGNRSILALPWLDQIQARMNALKQRESFRPFAPIVLEEDADKYFELEGPSPFMLDIAPVQAAHRKKLMGITHVDGTARVQTIGAYQDGLIRRTLLRLRQLNEPPVLLNTSFNLKGEPIVETPKDAVRAFINLGVDILLLQNVWVEKHTKLTSSYSGLARHGY